MRTKVASSMRTGNMSSCISIVYSALIWHLQHRLNPVIYWINEAMNEWEKECVKCWGNCLGNKREPFSPRHGLARINDRLWSLPYDRCKQSAGAVSRDSFALRGNPGGWERFWLAEVGGKCSSMHRKETCPGEDAGKFKGWRLNMLAGWGKVTKWKTRLQK